MDVIVIILLIIIGALAFFFSAVGLAFFWVFYEARKMMDKQREN